MKKVIAIDGPSGAGKTTIAKILAERLGFDYLDTGALYRAVALGLRLNNISPEDDDSKILSVLKSMTIEFTNGKVFLNKKDVSKDIRSPEIDHYSSVFSAKKIIREFLLDIQRNAGRNSNLIVEGRDTTTVVFPDAYKKIFLDASIEERARRRYLQLRQAGIETSMEEAIKGIIERDKRDSSRDLAPLKIAEDAFFIDSSNLSIDEVIKKIIDYIKSDC
jgi:cytidylate kinase